MDSSKALYLYGVIDPSDSQAVLGELEDVKPIRCLAIRPARPEEHREAGGELGALISEVSMEEFEEEALKTRLKDPKWLEHRIRHHEWVLETFMRVGTVIPMKFATIFMTEERLCERLLGLYETLRELCGKLQGKEEWGVKAFCDLRYIQVTAEAEHEQIKQLKAQLAGQPPGTAYLMKKQLEELVARETDQRLSRHLESIYQRLSSLAHEARLNLLTPHELTNRKHEMVLNAALLLEKISVSRLAEGVRALRQDYAPHGFEFEMVGPFPPYNFSQLPACAERSEADRPEGIIHE
jgi:hypothetical protein